MRALLVDGFGQSQPERQRFRDLERTIRAGFDAVHVDFLDLVVRRHTRLGDYIYEMDSPWIDRRSLTRFDRLDFVFVGGDANCLPWAKSMRQVFLLLKMCFQTGKCLFGTAFACQALGYMCATGGETIRVLNGGGKGGALASIAAFDVGPRMATLDATRCFL